MSVICNKITKQGAITPYFVTKLQKNYVSPKNPALFNLYIGKYQQAETATIFSVSPAADAVVEGGERGLGALSYGYGYLLVGNSGDIAGGVHVFCGRAAAIVYNYLPVRCDRYLRGKQPAVWSQADLHKHTVFNKLSWQRCGAGICSRPRILRCDPAQPEHRGRRNPCSQSEPGGESDPALHA